MQENILFEKTAEYSLKGKFAVWGNIIAAALLIGGLITAFFIFDFSGDYLFIGIVQSVVGIGIFLVITVTAMLAKLLTLKLFGGGKCGLHVGLVMEVYSTLPVSKLGYLAGEAYMLLVAVVIAVVSVFCWELFGVLMYVLIIFTLAILLPNIVLYAHILRQPKRSFFMLEKGILCTYVKKNISNANEE